MENMTQSSLDESVSENSPEIAGAEFVAAESTARRGLFADCQQHGGRPRKI